MHPIRRRLLHANYSKPLKEPATKRASGEVSGRYGREWKSPAARPGNRYFFLRPLKELIAARGTLVTRLVTFLPKQTFSKMESGVSLLINYCSRRVYR